MTWARLRIDMFLPHNLKTQKQLQGPLLTPAPPPEYPCCYLYFPLPLELCTSSIHPGVYWAFET